MSVQLHTAVSASRHHSRICRRRISHDAKLLYCGTTTSLSSYSLTGVAVPLYPQQSFPTELLLIIFNFVFDDLASYCTESPEAHKECVVCHSSYSSGQKHVVWEWQEDVSSYALFPYSLAGVCRRWTDIMATVPQFWTRLVIFVDDPLPPSLSLSPSLSPTSRAADICSYLKWSAQLPIEVYILRRRHSTSLGIDKAEQWRTQRVFEAIKPHIHRCHVLRFSVLQSTSLPSFVHDFAGAKAPVLTDLRLECEVDDTRVNVPRSGMFTIADTASMDGPMTQTTVAAQTSTYITQENTLFPLSQLQSSGAAIASGGFWCPNLSAISLNGRNFRDLALALRRSATITGGAQSEQHNQGPAADFHVTLQHVEKVTVAYYSASPGPYGSGVELLPSHGRDDDEFGLGDLLEVVRRERMPKLEFLKLVDLDLSVADSAEDVGVGGRKKGGEQERQAEVIKLTPSYIHLEELAPSVIRCFSAFLPVDGTHSSSSYPSPGFHVQFVNELESFSVIRSPLPLSSPSFPKPSPLPPAHASSSSTASLPSSPLRPSPPPSHAGGTGWVIPDACDLVLEEINDFYGRSSPLRSWQGCRLLFTGCNGVNNEFLKMLRSSSDNIEPVPSTSSSLPSSLMANSINAPNLQFIYLNDCNNYAIDELKSLIEVRNAGVSVADWGAPPCILELCVKGIRPELGEEDRRWFEERVRRFEWGERRERKRRRVSD